MKVAIGFFGLTRSLKHTISSINEKILDVLTKNNIEYDILMHTYYLTNINNVWAGEHDNSLIDNEEYKLLNPKYFIQDNQDEIKKQLNLELYRTQKDPWNTNYNTLDHFILASYSKYKLTNMIEEHINEYDYVLFVRPDCLYVTELDVNYFNLLKGNTILTPNFGFSGQHQTNDRFAITNKQTYKIYGRIFIHLLELSKRMSLHSETTMGLILLRLYRVNLHRINFYFHRVRMGGAVCPENFNSIYIPGDQYMTVYTAEK